MGKTYSKQRSNNVQNYAIRIETLTKNQKEVYEYLTRDFLTIKQIAERRQTSLKAVYNIVNKLISFNIIDKNFKKINNVQNVGVGFKTILRKFIVYTDKDLQLRS